MQKKIVICALAAVTLSVAQARGVEYECDDGNAQSGYRIRVVELSKEIREVIVLKKKNGSAKLVGDKKLRRIAGSSRFEYKRDGQKMSYQKTVTDSDGNWTGTFTLPGKGRTVRASCGRVETLTL